MNQILEVKNVTKYYGNGSIVTKALDGVSFSVEEEDFTAIMGASGSGKSTLLNVIATIDRVSAGDILVEGRSLTDMREEQLSGFRRDKLGFIFQEYNLLDTLTIEENIVLALTVWKEGKEEIRKKCAGMLRLLDIEGIKDKFPYQVSGGQKQRCACARALINRPSLLLADEPTGALDSRSSQTLLETFADMNHSLNATILMVTHDVFSASYCSRILFLKDGKLFHELVRGTKDRRTFLNEILDVLSLTGGGFPDAR